ncbi:MAG: hypothetical protein LBB98_00750 [Treponema sp.]|jgi:hypothetical protein|nr:hypothetical protein [Treponema sp.]
MKKAKQISFFTLGFLAVLLTGCFNSLPVVLPNQNDPNINPFTVDIQVGKDTGDARSAAGPDAARIKGDLRNIVQLIVVDKDGNIVAFDEVRRKNEDPAPARLTIDSIDFGQTYAFLLLMGYWKHDGNYNYDEGEPPTLLAAGLKEQLVTGNGKITVTMWPMVVDTTFVSEKQTVEPVVNAGQPKAATLHPVDWNVKWTIRRGLTGNGLTDLVLAQKKIPNSATEDALLFNSKPQILVRAGTDEKWINVGSSNALTENVITGSIGTYTSGFQRIGTKGSVNFKLEYIPFHLTGGESNPWAAFDKKSAFDLKKGGPVWIIRNGVNDESQNDNTNFNSFHNIAAPPAAGTPNPNGNGAVRYGIAVRTPADGSQLKVQNGAFVGPWSSTTPEITFTTSGYTGDADVYYAVVETGKNPPDYSGYTLQKPVGPGKQKETITVPKAHDNYDVYVIIYKDGEVSNPVIISTIPENFTLRIIRLDKSSDSINKIVLVPVISDSYDFLVYRTGYTGVKWVTGSEDLTEEKKFKERYPHAQYYQLRKFDSVSPNPLTDINDWADVTVDWPDGSVTGYYLFFIEGDGRVRGYANPGKLAPNKDENFLFFIRPDYVYKQFLLPMGTYNSNGHTQVDPKTMSYHEVIPIGYSTYYNVSSIMKSMGVWKIPKHDAGDIPIL